MSGGPLRSVLLTPNLLGADGVSALSRAISRALPAPVAVLSLHDGSGTASGLAPGIEFQTASGSRASFLAAAAGLSLRCSAGTDIVCSHLHLAPAAALQAWRGGRVTTVLCGIECWVPLRKAEAWALERSSLISISGYTAARFREANPAFAGVDVTICHPGLPDSTAVPSPVAAGGAPALIVARMSAEEKYKGHDELIDLWPGVLARHSDARLLVAGDGNDRPRLESRVRSLGLSRVITFLGRVPDDELTRLYQECRFVVMPSRDEGFGLVFLEAMRAGKACIGGQGAASEIIEHDRTGLVVRPGCHRELAAAVARLFDDVEACRRFGAAGRERFGATFTDVCFQSRFAKALEHRVMAG
jgi:glycosyltransferase involved in cell wall biosynthesis